MPISEEPAFHSDANELEMADKMSKVIQSPYTSVQKSELYAIFMILVDFSETLNKLAGSKYEAKLFCI